MQKNDVFFFQHYSLDAHTMEHTQRENEKESIALSPFSFQVAEILNVGWRERTEIKKKQEESRTKINLNSHIMIIDHEFMTKHISSPSLSIFVVVVATPSVFATHKNSIHSLYLIQSSAFYRWISSFFDFFFFTGCCFSFFCSHICTSVVVVLCVFFFRRSDFKKH